MKYIRTKDGRIVKHPHPNAEVFTFRYEILKTADTIEGLCDKFIMNTYLTHYIDSHLKDLLLEYDKFHIKDGITIYGAIWTEWGLKYVAKMNDKGELELI